MECYSQLKLDDLDFSIIVTGQEWKKHFICVSKVCCDSDSRSFSMYYNNLSLEVVRQFSDRMFRNVMQCNSATYR